jgi:outer membrane protein TolC
MTLHNSKVLRNLGGRVDAQTDQLLRNPDFAQTVYEPALQETSVGINAPIGPEAALSAFDAQFSSSVFWERNETPLNIQAPVGQILGIPTTSIQEAGTFQAQLSKTGATGNQFSLRNTTQYDQSNDPRRLFPSEWRTNIEAEVRQPLLQGAGTQYNRIAGPFNPLAGVGTRSADGVVIARINTDRSLADFEAGVRDLLRDVESAYWQLYFSYRDLEARKLGLDSARNVWSIVNARTPSLLGAQDEGRAREQYFTFRALVETAKSDLFAAEARLRFLMGLSTSDGRLIRPADEPLTAKVSFDWHEVLGESLGRNVELRKQKWRIKQRELELIAAKNHLLPRLDAVGRYRWNGFGDDLIDSRGDGEGRFNSAIGNLVDGHFQDWHLELQFSLPLGFRQELAAVRNAELSLTRDKTILREQELELSHLLAESVRQIYRQFQSIETNFNRRTAAEAQISAIQERIRREAVTDLAVQVDLLLDAQRRLTEADISYYRAIVDYNRAVTQLHFHKGSLLEYNQVFLAEGPWPCKAYFDATRLARQRDASLYLDYGFTRPKVFSRGPYRQETRFPGEHNAVPSSNQPDASAGPAPEELPVPAPEVINPDTDSVSRESSVVRQSAHWTNIGPVSGETSQRAPAAHALRWRRGTGSPSRAADRRTDPGPSTTIPVGDTADTVDRQSRTEASTQRQTSGETGTSLADREPDVVALSGNLPDRTRPVSQHINQSTKEDAGGSPREAGTANKGLRRAAAQTRTSPRTDPPRLERAATYSTGAISKGFRRGSGPSATGATMAVETRSQQKAATPETSSSGFRR